VCGANFVDEDLMPFDWLHAHVPRRPQHRDEMYRRELRERAALLQRLGYSRADARVRLAANLDWDFEIGAGHKAVSDRELDEIVDEVWKRGGAAGGGPPTV
jgi:hypothetical protein